MKNKSIVLLFLSLLSCNSWKRDAYTIINQSGNNKLEFQKVISYYKSKDKEKLEAAYFLIANLDGKYAVGGAELLKFNPIFDLFGSLRLKNLQITNNSVYVKSKWDSILTVVGPLNIKSAEIVPDYKTIKAEYLIHNIDLAFAIRDSVPWGHKIRFDQFCEYVLAYRFNHEPLEDWRSYYFDKYRKMCDTLKHDSILRFASHFHNLIPRTGSLGLFSNYPFDFRIEQLERGQMGTCMQIATSRAQIMRSAGIPVAVDFTPGWGDRGASHNWNSVLSENGKWKHYEGTLPSFGQDLVYRVAKVYRKTFGRQNVVYTGNEQEIPQSLRKEHLIDVTQEYTKTKDIQVPLKYISGNQPTYAIISVSNSNNWVPLDFGAVKNGKAFFKNMGKGSLYLVQFYNEGRFSTASDPFILKENGELVFISPDVNKTKAMKLMRKYPLSKSIEAYHQGVVGCFFQGANQPDFRDSVILHTITAAQDHIVSVKIFNPKKFRYIRFKSPLHDKGDIAEVAFYGGNKSSDTIKLTGKVIGFPEVPKTFGTPYQNALDGNIDTYFHGFYSGKLWWAGLDLGSPRVITKIKYCPRSDTNFIVEGDRYELCYWKEDEWASMGEQVAAKPSLEYNNVPSGGLYILHNLSRGKEERIFTFEDGKQVFW